MSKYCNIFLYLLHTEEDESESLSHVYSVTPWTVAHRLLCPWGFSRQEYWNVLPCPPPGYLPNPGIESRSPALQVDSLLPEPLGKPKNTGVGSTSLIQGVFLIQESNPGLLHCRQILYQLSYQESPFHCTQYSINNKKIHWNF